MISPVSPELLEEARYLAGDAALVYKSHSTALINAKYGTRFRIIEKKNVRVLLEETELDQTIVFSGTDDFWDWWANVKFCPVRRTDIGLVHDGVADLYASVKDEIAAFLDPKKVLRLAGHSQGAGPMAITAIHAAKRGQPIVAAHTFNGMMFGDEATCDVIKALGIPLHTWIIGWDQVCNLPPLGGYCKAGDVHFIGLDGKILAKQPGFFSGRPWRTWFRGELNHSMVTVRDTLEKIRL